jgi:signal transduction histidine kinase
MKTISPQQPALKPDKKSVVKTKSVPSAKAPKAPAINAVLTQGYKEREDLSNQLTLDVIDPLSRLCLDFDRSIHSLQIPAKHDKAIPHLKKQLQEVRRLFRNLTAFDLNLYPNVLKELGLEAAVKSQAREFTERCPNVRVLVTLDVAIEKPNKDRSIAVYIAIKECLARIESSGSVDLVEISLTTTLEHSLIVCVTDNATIQTGIPQAELLVPVIQAAVSQTGGVCKLELGRQRGAVFTFSWQALTGR